MRGRNVPFRYLEDVAIADVAFEAEGATLGETFGAAADATLAVMVGEPSSVLPRVRASFAAEDEALDILLLRFLEELVYRKDAEGLLLRSPDPRVERRGGLWSLRAELAGERIDPSRHRLLLDVKAVTLHLLSVEQTPGGWRARVVLDV